MIVAANIEFSKWVTVFGDDKMAAAVVDRLVYTGRLVEFNGASCRIESRVLCCLLVLPGHRWLRSSRDVAAAWILQLKRPVSLVLVGETGLFWVWVCGLTKVMPAGSYFEFLMRRVAVAVIPSPAAAIPASAIALGAGSPVFASLPAVVFACLPLLVFACLVVLGGVSLPVAGEPVGCVVSAGCAEPEGGVVSVGCVISGEVALSAAAFASSYALQASS